MLTEHGENVKHSLKLLERSKTFNQIREDLGLEKSGTPVLCVDYLVREVMWCCFTVV